MESQVFKRVIGHVSQGVPVYKALKIEGVTHTHNFYKELTLKQQRELLEARYLYPRMRSHLYGTTDYWIEIDNLLLSEED